MNNPLKIMLVFGTRPEAIKMAPLYLELKKYPSLFRPLICVTAQHREMLDQVLNLFCIDPDIDLNLMSPGQDLFDLSSNILTGMRDVLTQYKPDIALVHGDTTTALFSALACFYMQGIKVGHVEAGLRTYDFQAPFPEELNRQIISKLANWHFVPSLLARSVLINEGIPESNIIHSGNTVIDALFLTIKKIEKSAEKKDLVERYLSDFLPFNWQVDKYIVVTGHRRENFGDGFSQICNSIKILSSQHPDVHFVYPVHLNPNVHKPVMRALKDCKNVHLIPPLDYENFSYLLKFCYLILTDSGGIQEEAPSLGKPVLVMRDVTERPEAVAAGTVKLVGANADNIIANVNELLNNHDSYRAMTSASNPYGGGDASEKIVKFLKGINSA